MLNLLQTSHALYVLHLLLLIPYVDIYADFCFLPILTSRFPTTQDTAKSTSTPPKIVRGFMKRAEDG